MLDVKARDSAFKKCENTVNKWLATEAESPYFANIPAECHRSLKAGDISLLDLDLPLYATYMCGVSASQLIVEQNYEKGMESLCLSYSYYILSHRFLLINEKARGTSFGGYAGRFNDLIGVLAMALCFDDKPSVEMLVEYINGAAASGEMQKGFIDMPFADFVKRLTRLYLGTGLDTEGLPDTVYSDIFRSWDQDDQKSNIENVLDAHLMGACHKKGYEKPHEDNFPDFFFVSAFDREHMMLLPVEMMALYGVRYVLGLGVNSEIEHPLSPPGFWDRISNSLDLNCSDEFILAANDYLNSLLKV